MTEATEKIRERVLALIDSEFESDASFERELGLSEKTVSNWRRGRSASFMNMLPMLAESFKVSLSQIMNVPLSQENSDLSDGEIELLALYRKARALPEEMRSALTETLETTIKLYINTYLEIRKSEKKKSRARK